MLPECPEDLRHLLPYLQRASELKSREPVIAYYCGFYAVNLALTRGYPKKRENDLFITALFDELEQEKRELAEEPAMRDQEQAHGLILQFAMRIFLTADNEDRAGQSTKRTGRLFLVASQFLEVTRAFGSVPEEIEERIRYAKWKAAEIVKALSEGRQPQAGPPTAAATVSGAEHQLSMTSTSSTSGAPSTTCASPPMSPPGIAAAPVAHAGPIVSPPPAADVRATTGHSFVSPTLDPVTLAAAEKHARFAVSALQFEDVLTAIQNMEAALQLLRGLQKK